MYLSSVYANKPLYAMVYRTGHACGNEVELVANKFFSSQKKVEKWFARYLNRKGRTADWYLDPKAVMVTGLTKLLITDPNCITEPNCLGPSQMDLEWT